jgi:hypothetical protein
MFTKTIDTKTWSDEIITFDELVNQVKNNPNKDLILKARKLGKVSNRKEYDRIKLSIPCILPHVITTGLKGSTITSFTNYLYYDIDGFETIDILNDTIDRLVKEFPISFIQKSFGGMGISFLIKIETDFEINQDTFIDLYKYVRLMLIDKDFNIDTSAGGSVRRMVISYDDNPYVNKNSLLKINLNDFKEVKTNQKNINNNVITLNVHLKLIPYKDLKIKTKLQYEPKEEIEICDKETYTIIVPSIITDGRKHKTYIRLINALYFINNKITKEEVFSFLYYINEAQAISMDRGELSWIVNRVASNIEATGEILIKPRIKKIHFNKNLNIKTKDKQSMGRKISAQLQSNKTINDIRNAIDILILRNEVVTHKAIASLIGKSTKTVSRQLKNEKVDIELLAKELIDEAKEKIYDESIDKINDIISADEFFNEDLYDSIKNADDAYKN